MRRWWRRKPKPHMHGWTLPTRLPRGTQQTCVRCGAWRGRLDSGREIILEAWQMDRAARFLLALEEIDRLPEVQR